MAPEPQRIIAYSALYLDEKESFETAETQISENIDEAAAVGKDPSDIYIAVDIIATPAQIASGVAKKCAERIMTFVDRTFPQSGRAIGITDNDKRRRRQLGDLALEIVQRRPPALKAARGVG